MGSYGLLRTLRRPRRRRRPHPTRPARKRHRRRSPAPEPACRTLRAGMAARCTSREPPFCLRIAASTAKRCAVSTAPAGQMECKRATRATRPYAPTNAATATWWDPPALRCPSATFRRSSKPRRRRNAVAAQASYAAAHPTGKPTKRSSRSISGSAIGRSRRNAMLTARCAERLDPDGTRNLSGSGENRLQETSRAAISVTIRSPKCSSPTQTALVSRRSDAILVRLAGEVSFVAWFTTYPRMRKPRRAA